MLVWLVARRGVGWGGGGVGGGGFFFFNDTATTEIYTLSLHDALPILTLAHTINQFDGATFLVNVFVVAVVACPAIIGACEIGRAHV